MTEPGFPMTSLTCADILAGCAPKDAPVTLKGWVRTRRDSKAGISFVHVSDGSSFHPVQVVAPSTLPNYSEEILKLTAGCAVEATGDRAEGLAREDGSPLFDPTLPGGAAAGLRSIVGEAELLELGWRTLSLAAGVETEEAPWKP